MAKYQVLKTFDGFPRGQVVEIPDWKNREKLVRNKFLAKVEDAKAEIPVKEVEESPALPVAKRGRKKSK